MTTYTTKDGDTVDYICAKFYGATSGGRVEAVFAANPGLADIPLTPGAVPGPELPAGIKITLPVVDAPITQIVKIFGDQ